LPGGYFFGCLGKAGRVLGRDAIRGLGETGEQRVDVSAFCPSLSTMERIGRTQLEMTTSREEERTGEKGRESL